MPPSGPRFHTIVDKCVIKAPDHAQIPLNNGVIFSFKFNCISLQLKVFNRSPVSTSSVLHPVLR